MGAYGRPGMTVGSFPPEDKGELGGEGARAATGANPAVTGSEVRW